MVFYNWELEQRSPEWKEARLGKVGGSEAVGLTTPARTKTLVLDKATELLTGEIPEVYVNDAMQRGIDCEESVVVDYQLSTGETVLECGQVTNEEFKYAALSPDGLIQNEDEVIVGGIEIKCPNSKTHISTIMEGKIPTKYRPQIVHYFMIIDTLEYLDFISFDDRVPNIPFKEYRVTRDDLQADIDKAIANYHKFENQLENVLESFEAL